MTSKSAVFLAPKVEQMPSRKIVATSHFRPASDAADFEMTEVRVSKVMTKEAFEAAA
jgi:hypothetical protein